MTVTVGKCSFSLTWVGIFTSIICHHIWKICIPYDLAILLLEREETRHEILKVFLYENINLYLALRRQLLGTITFPTMRPKFRRVTWYNNLQLLKLRCKNTMKWKWSIWKSSLQISTQCSSFVHVCENGYLRSLKLYALNSSSLKSEC